MVAGSDARIRICRLDVTNSKAVAALKEKIGPAPIAISINNTGITDRHFTTMDYKAWADRRRLYYRRRAPAVSKALLKRLP